LRPFLTTDNFPFPTGIERKVFIASLKSFTTDDEVFSYVLLVFVEGVFFTFSIPSGVIPIRINRFSAFSDEPFKKSSIRGRSNESDGPVRIVSTAFGILGIYRCTITTLEVFEVFHCINSSGGIFGPAETVPTVPNKTIHQTIDPSVSIQNIYDM